MKRLIFRFCLPWMAVAAGCGEPARPTRPAEVARPAARPVPSFAEVVAPALSNYCVECHGSASKEGGVALDDFPDGPSAARDDALWGRVADAIRSGSMPPAGRPGLDPATRSAVLDSIDAEVFGCSDPRAILPGRVALRRLNRMQYNNTVRDLVGVDVRPGDAFPADDLGYGFDNNGDVLSISPLLMEKYLDSAESVMAALRRDREAWDRIANPSPDVVPVAFRKRAFPARSDPVKRIGRPEPQATPVQDPEAVFLARAREILRAFADRAFRRPATDEELTRLVGLVESARKDGDDPDEAIRQALRAVLVSPRFLFLVEEQGDDSKAGTRPLSPFELAARLACFLWGSLPDDELWRAAVGGDLNRDDVLESQARRMLADRKSAALVEGFVFQWLQVRGLASASPDPKAYPGFDESLRRSMLRETALLGEAILFGDRPVFDFLDADFTFVDERLARHYGLSGVSGPNFRRVSLAGSHRRGVLTHASVLTSTSSPTRASLVRRGRWILDNLLGTPPAPPPPDAEGLGDSPGSTAPSTLRRRMERHRADARCASCHAQMDPLGFGLENFDGIGAWREADAGSPIDASGRLPGEPPFRGPDELMADLATRRRPFARCLAEKLLTYALGRGTSPTDRCLVDGLARTLDRDDPRFSALIVGIVESPAFRNRAVPGIGAPR